MKLVMNDLTINGWVNKSANILLWAVSLNFPPVAEYITLI